ncbi:MAG: hypothetical protein U0794_21150 [Isosphaeraceae bacterium]
MPRAMNAMGLEFEPEPTHEAVMAAQLTEAPRPAITSHEPEEPRFGALLSLWMGLTVVILAVLWITGFTSTRLITAVEQGAARAEWRFVGEVGDDLIRKAVRTQHDTITFWTVLAFLGQFLGEPLLLAVRALAVATTFSAVAALMGRPIGYDRALAACVAAQGIWVLGAAVRAALMIGLRQVDVETSATLLLPAGTYPAWMYLIIAQADLFALIGWSVMAWGGIKRGQVGPVGALLICLGCWTLEAALRVGVGTVVGAAMRLSLMPG